ncbi:MAG: hypothetical protein KAS32_26030, partial [Candidatus Peribacteraceae bacterium]|nr:hypothetical protein [Candidatus Peribacteraceae bacterium]
TLNNLYDNGYLQVQPPVKTAYQRYTNWHEDAGVCTADLEDYSAQEVYNYDYIVWEEQLNQYRINLSDSTEHLIQFLIGEGIINPTNLPATLKQLYQDKTAHIALEPQTP